MLGYIIYYYKKNVNKFYIYKFNTNRLSNFNVYINNKVYIFKLNKFKNKISSIIIPFFLSSMIEMIQVIFTIFIEIISS